MYRPANSFKPVYFIYALCHLISPFVRFSLAHSQTVRIILAVNEAFLALTNEKGELIRVKDLNLES